MCILCVCVKINVCLNLSEFQSSWAQSSMVAAWMGDPWDTLCYSPASTGLQSETWYHWARSLATLQPLQACRVKHGSTEQDRLLSKSKLSTIDHGHHTDGWPLHFVPTPASNSVQSLQKSFRWEYMYTKVPPHVYTHKKIPSPMHVKDHVVHVRVRWIMGTIKQHSQWIMGTIKLQLVDYGNNKITQSVDYGNSKVTKHAHVKQSE